MLNFLMPAILFMLRKECSFLPKQVRGATNFWLLLRGFSLHSPLFLHSLQKLKGEAAQPLLIFFILSLLTDFWPSGKRIPGAAVLGRLVGFFTASLQDFSPRGRITGG
jgi:hypothetical protein